VALKSPITWNNVTSGGWGGDHVLNDMPLCRFRMYVISLYHSKYPGLWKLPLIKQRDKFLETLTNSCLWNVDHLTGMLTQMHRFNLGSFYYVPTSYTLVIFALICFSSTWMPEHVRISSCVVCSSISKVALAAYFHRAHYNSPMALAAYFHRAHYNSPMALVAYFLRAHYNSPVALAAYFHTAHYNSPVALAAYFHRAHYNSPVALAAYFHRAHYNSPLALAAYFHRAHYNSPMALAAYFHRAHYNSPVALVAYFCRYPASRGISRAVPKVSECKYNYSSISLK
jgi:hypothetical protein